MGTRSLTVFKNGDEEIAVLYRQFDGYPTGHGDELAGFLKGKTMVNGISGDRREVFNGMHALTAQVIAYFADAHNTGDFYVYPAGARGCGEEYIYEVTGSIGEEPTIIAAGYGEPIFDGPASKFNGEMIEAESAMRDARYWHGVMMGIN